MNFLSLEYFLAIAEDHSFTSAANRLYVSQQSLSEHIKKLEQEIGTPLLVRKRPLELTPAGKIFADAAKNILTMKSNMLRDIANTLEHVERRLTIAVPTYETPPTLPEMLTYFSTQYPNIEVSVVKRADFSIADNMAGVNLYLSIVPLNENLDHFYLIRNEYRCVVFRQSVLQKTYGDRWESVAEQLRKTGDLRVAKEIPFIALNDPQGNLAPFFTDTMNDFGIHPNISFQSDNGELNSAFCLRGTGARVGIFFQMYSRFRLDLDKGEDPMLLFPIRTRLDSCPLAISYAKGHHLNTAETCFLTAAKEHLLQYTAENMHDPKYCVDHLPPNCFY